MQLTELLEKYDIFTEEEAVELLQERISEYRVKNDYAKELNCNWSYISRMISGKDPLPERVREDLKLEKFIVYGRRVEE